MTKMEKNLLSNYPNNSIFRTFKLIQTTQNTSLILVIVYEI